MISHGASRTQSIRNVDNAAQIAASSPVLSEPQFTMYILTAVHLYLLMIRR